MCIVIPTFANSLCIATAWRRRGVEVRRGDGVKEKPLGLPAFFK